MIIILLARPGGLLGKPLVKQTYQSTDCQYAMAGHTEPLCPLCYYRCNPPYSTCFHANVFAEHDDQVSYFGTLRHELEPYFWVYWAFLLGACCLLRGSRLYCRYSDGPLWHWKLLDKWFSRHLDGSIAAAVFGFIALRVSGLFFLLVTFALGQFSGALP